MAKRTLVIPFKADPQNTSQRASAKTRLHIALGLLRGLRADVANKAEEDNLSESISALEALEFD